MFKYRSLLRKICLDVISKFSQPKKGIHILNGHFIAPYKAEGEVFFDLLSELSKTVKFIDIQEATQLITTKKFDQKEILVAFTFDDGFEECYTDITPSLDYFDIKAAFFINPNFVNGDATYINNFLKNVVYLDGFKLPMRWNQILTLHNQGHVIGAHTMDHMRLDIYDEQVLNHQIVDCKNYLEKQIGYKCEYFAYPYGQLTDISEQAIEIAAGNFKYNFTQSNYRQYFSFNNRFINRRHFEGNWPQQHVKYFLKSKN